MDITNIKLSHTQIAALQMLEAGAAKTRSEMRLSLEAMRQLTQHKFAESDGWYAYHITSDGRDYLEMVGKSSTAQRIAALEAENAALKAERDALRELLDEAKQVIAPIARNERFFVRFKELGMPKADRTKSLFDYSGTYFQYIVNPINAIKVGDIIDAAEFASKLAAKLDEQSK